MDIKDDEFDDGFRLDNDGRDRIGGGGTAHVGAPRGLNAAKQIFAKSNRKRLGFSILAGLGLIAAVIWAVYSVNNTDAPQGGQVGVTRAGRMPATAQNGAATLQQQEMAQDYNNRVLPEEQRANPAAHPMMVTEPTPDRQINENPYETKSDFKSPEKVSEIGSTQHGQPSTAKAASKQPVDYKSTDDLIQKLVANEDEAPKALKVDWNYASADRSAKVQKNNSDGAGADGAENAETTEPKCTVVQRAGQTEFATPDFAVNSDIGGDVSFTIRSGPNANSQLMGKFERKDVWLRIQLDKMVTKTETLKTNAIALDINTSMSAVEGDLDSHILYRYGWWGVGTVLKAIGEAARSNGNQSVIIADGAVVTTTAQDTAREMKMALGSLGNDMGSAFQERLKRPITVSLKKTDQVGIFFLDDVCSRKVKSR